MDWLNLPLLANPWTALLIATAAALVPILLHLWNRRRPRVVRWGAMRLLQEALRRTRRQARWRERLLLAMRILAVLLILGAVTLPQPWARDLLAAFWPGAGLPASSTAGRTHRVVILDSSLSMAWKDDGESAWERAQRQIEDKVVGHARPGDGFTLVLMRSPPQVLFAAPCDAPDEFLQALKEARQTHGPADLRETCALVAGLVQRSPPKYSRREVYFFTDLQTATWRPKVAREKDDIAITLARLLEAASVNLVDLGSDHPVNCAVTDLSMGRTLCLTDEEVTFRAAIWQFGDDKAAKLPVSLGIGTAEGHTSDKPVDIRVQEQKLVSLRQPEAGTTAREKGATPVEFRHRFTAPGTYVVQVRVDSKDGLEADDACRLIVQVRARLDVLLVDGSPYGPFTERETHYLRRALANRRYRVQPRVIAPQDLANQTPGSPDSIEAADCVVLCNVPPLGPREVQRLEQHLRRGGGVLFFLGDQVDLAAYNQLLHRDGQGLLPVELLSRESAPPSDARQAFMFDPLGYRHPLAHEFGERTETGLLSARFRQYLRVRVPPDAGASVALNFVPESLPGPVAAKPEEGRSDFALPLLSALAHLDVAGSSAMEPRSSTADPAVVEASWGRGKVYVVTTAANLKWSSWPLNNSYVPLVQEMLLASITARTQGRAALLGQPLEALATKDETGVTMLTPDGRHEPVTRTERPGHEIFRFEETVQGGIYRLTPSKASSKDRLFAVNVPLDEHQPEADPRRLSESELRQLYPDWAFVYSSSPRVGQASATGAASNWSRFCLLAGLLLLLVELLIARRVAVARS